MGCSGCEYRLTHRRPGEDDSADRVLRRERSMNAAKYVNPSLIFIDLDKDPDAFHKNRELVLGQEPIGPTKSVTSPSKVAASDNQKAKVPAADVPKVRVEASAKKTIATPVTTAPIAVPSGKALASKKTNQSPMTPPPSQVSDLSQRNSTIRDDSLHAGSSSHSPSGSQSGLAAASDSNITPPDAISGGPSSIVIVPPAKSAIKVTIKPQVKPPVKQPAVPNCRDKESDFAEKVLRTGVVPTPKIQSGVDLRIGFIPWFERRAKSVHKKRSVLPDANVRKGQHGHNSS